MSRSVFGWSMPPGAADMGYRPQEEVTVKCPEGHEWTAEMYGELGGWFFVDEDKAFCPECDKEGEVQD